MIAILADDLTSALDAAAPFATRGLSARVLLDASEFDSLGADVVAVDLDSRFADAACAEASFRAAAARVAGATMLFKTIDSTLRGNLGVEVRGALRGSGRVRAVVAPAFPAAGRTTIDGHQFVSGVPVEKTAFARDPRTPIVSGRVSDRLADLDSSSFNVHDAAHDRDLDELVLQIGIDSDLLWVGSPGLAGALARALPAPSKRTPSPSWHSAGRVLVVIGSMHPANREQAQRLGAAGASTVWVGEGHLDAATIADAVARAFDAASVVCLLAPEAPRLGGADASARLARVLGAVVQRCAARFDGLIATGGDTARRIVDAIQVSALDLAGEVEPGVPVGLLRAPDRNIPFVTKAGGFGHSGTLLSCVDRLRSQQDLAA